MTTNMKERFDEKFPLQQLHDCYELTGHLAKDGEMLAFIQSEIDIAVAKREEELVESCPVIEDIKVEDDWVWVKVKLEGSSEQSFRILPSNILKQQ